MVKRRPRLVPKIVFRVALGATAVPMLGGCRHEPAPGVAQSSYGPVAQRAYDPQPVEDASPVLPQLGVAAPAFVNPRPVDASADVKVDAAKLDTGKLDAGKLDAGKRDAAVAGPVLPVVPPNVKGVALRAYDVEGVAYRGYEDIKPKTPPPKKP